MRRNTSVGFVLISIFLSGALSVFAAPSVEARDLLVNDGESKFAVVELFTSEGCSSCPPGEEALAAIRDASVAGNLPVVTIAWHVDYWDSLGWPDPWGSREASERQRWYARQLESSRYTPQTIVDGQVIASWAGNGDEIAEIVRGRLSLAREEVLSVSVDGSSRSDALNVGFYLENRGRYDVEAILVEDGLSSRPTAGENRGRNLQHVSTVRSSAAIPSGADSVELAVPDDLVRSNASVVVLVRRKEYSEILAANRMALPGSGLGSAAGRLIYANGKPAAGSVLQFCTDTLCIPVETDESGRFLLENLVPGHYQVKSMYWEEMPTVLVAAGERTEVRLPIPPENGKGETE